MVEIDYWECDATLLAGVTMGCLVGLLVGVAFGLILSTSVGGLCLGVVSGMLTSVVSVKYIERRNMRLTGTPEEA